MHEAYFPIQIENKTYLNKEIIIFLLYYGFSLMMIILNIILFVFFRDKVYISYSFFLSIITLSLFYDDGLFAYFFPTLIHYYDIIELYTHWFTSIGATWFCFSFLGTNNIKPIVRKGFYTFIALAFIFYTWSAISFHFSIYKLAGLSVYIVFIGTWILPLYFFKKYNHIRILVFAYFFILFILFTSMGYYLLRVEGIQFIKISPNNIKFGGVIEIILITISILYRFKLIEKESEKNKQTLLNYINNNSINREKNLSFIKAITNKFKLTDREKDVLEELIQQKSNKEIAKALFISVPTVKFHISNILAKLNAKNRIELIDKIKT